jgi:arylsulfatase A-like enzyme
MMTVSRRGFLKTIGTGAAALGAGLGCAEEKKPKNVLILYVDDLRPEINCYGKSKLITPNIDKLARESVVFNKAYCQIPISMPSRVSTLSGMYPRGRGQGILRRLLPKGKLSLPGHFKANGYDTISMGKVYHFNKDDPESWTKRYEHTFHEKQYVCDGWCAGYQLEENLKGRTYARTGRNQSALVECVDAPDNAYPDGETADKAVAEIKKYGKSGKPLFLAAGFYRPHLPWVAPKKYWDMYKREEIDLAKNQFFPKGAISRNTWGDLVHYGDEVVNAAGSKRTDWNAENFPVLPEDKQRELIHGYWACVSFLDAQIGRILDALEDAGMADNTIVVFLSDHGWQLGEHRLWSKCSNYEEAIRVPFMISVPGVTKGAKTDSLTELVDIYPTVCEFSGLSIPEHVEGVSMMPLLKDPKREWKKAAFNIWGGAQSMRTKRYRLTMYGKPMPKGGRYQLPCKGRYEIYDYETDPAGGVNIAADPKNKALLDKLTAMMDAGWKGARPDGCGK